MVDVVIYQSFGHRRSQVIAQAMYMGIRSTRDRARIKDPADYREPEAKVAVFYGFKDKLPRIMADYRDSGRTAIYIDLGYWARHHNGRYGGYHKIVVNDRHPTAYFQKFKHPTARMMHLGLRPEPWRTGGKSILIAGMGAKAAGVDGLRAEEWERETIAALAKITDRPLIYRPKPSWKEAVPIPGTTFSPREQPLAEVLASSHAVVTHHSNVAVDGLIFGVPAFCWGGVATPLSLQDLTEIERPYFPKNRDQWIADIAYTQWTVDEIKRGLPWRHLKSEGLVP